MVSARKSIPSAVPAQAVVENAKSVVLNKEHYPVRRTPKRGLRQVDFILDGNDIRGLEQNPNNKFSVGTNGAVRKNDAVPQRRAWPQGPS